MTFFNLPSFFKKQKIGYQQALKKEEAAHKKKLEALKAEYYPGSVQTNDPRMQISAIKSAEAQLAAEKKKEHVAQKKESHDKHSLAAYKGKVHHDEKMGDTSKVVVAEKKKEHVAKMKVSHDKHSTAGYKGKVTHDEKASIAMDDAVLMTPPHKSPKVPGAPKKPKVTSAMAKKKAEADLEKRIADFNKKSKK